MSTSSNSSATLSLSQSTDGPVFGPGADHRDWYDIHALFPEILKPVAPVDQAVGLPNLSDVIMILEKEPAPALQRREDYPCWYYQIYGILKEHNLHLLLDQAIPKPMNNDINASNWFSCSLYIRNWLIKSVSPYLLREVRREGLHFEFADDLMGALEPHRPPCTCCWC